MVSIGLMNIAENRSDFLRLETSNQSMPTDIVIDGLGINSVQSVEISKMDTSTFCLYLVGEGAVTHLTFCTDKASTTNEPSHFESEFPSVSPSGAPSLPASNVASPSLEPSGSIFPSGSPIGISSDSPSVEQAALSPTGVPSGSSAPSDTPSLQETTSSPIEPSISPIDELPSANPSGSSLPSDLPSSHEGSVIGSEEPSGSQQDNSTKVPEEEDILTPDAFDSPSSSPSDSPSFYPTTASQRNACAEPVVVDFDTAGNGTRLERGAYVADEWSERYGLDILAFVTIGGFAPDNKARIFDTAQPFTNASGDVDLGSPHRYVKIPATFVSAQFIPYSSLAYLLLHAQTL
jgi:hypothetical protein